MENHKGVCSSGDKDLNVGNDGHKNLAEECREFSGQFAAQEFRGEPGPFLFDGGHQYKYFICSIYNICGSNFSVYFL